MKINGQDIKGKNLVTVFIPRENGGYEFVCQPVDLDEFEKFCPVPMPPMITRPGKMPQPDFTDKKYKAAIEEQGQKRVAFMVVNSLLATSGFSWDTVVLDDPNTWQNYQQEFKNADLSNVEVNRIINAIFQANSLDDNHIRAAHEHFLASKRLQEVSALFRQEEPETSPSGEPVKDSE